MLQVRRHPPSELHRRLPRQLQGQQHDGNMRGKSLPEDKNHHARSVYVTCLHRCNSYRCRTSAMRIVVCITVAGFASCHIYSPRDMAPICTFCIMVIRIIDTSFYTASAPKGYCHMFTSLTVTPVKFGNLLGILQGNHRRNIFRWLI